MQIAQIRRILWCVGGVASAGAVAVIASLAYLPLHSSAEISSQLPRPPLAADAKGPVKFPLSAFQSAWSVPLRRPLVDPTVAATASAEADVATKSTELAVRLVGTIVDGQHPRGVFITGLNNIELKNVGDIVGGATVLSIEENSATLTCNGNTITLHREKKPFDPSGESYDAAAPATDTKPASE